MQILKYIPTLTNPLSIKKTASSPSIWLHNIDVRKDIVHENNLATKDVFLSVGKLAPKLKPDNKTQCASIYKYIS
jgi:predicted alpha/beta superfamily hydrolase